MLQAMKNIAKIAERAPIYAVMAGGAVRDIDNGKRPKDIDIFCTYGTPEAITETLDYFKNNFHLRYSGQVPADGDYEEGIGEIHSVHNFIYIPNLLDVQIIFMKLDLDEADVVKQITNAFDLEICQAAMYYLADDDKFMISKTDGYKQNKVDGVIRLTERGKALAEGQASDRTRARASKIANKLNFRTNLVFNYQREEERNVERERNARLIGEFMQAVRNVPPVQNMVVHPDQYVRYVNAAQNQQIANVAPNNNWQLFNGWR